MLETDEIKLGDSISRHDISPETMELACDLSERHGTVKIVEEASGVHLYLASPVCLQNYGEDEYFKMHLAVNADKYLRDNEDLSAMCMKTDTPYKVTELLGMTMPFSGGGRFKPGDVRILARKDEDMLEADANGNMVPKTPGRIMVSIDKLPQDHHVIQYLRSRDFDAKSLVRQFNAEYCYLERDDMYYRYLGHGFKDTPQERIIFYADVLGVRKAWQGRILEFVEDDVKFFFHPYRRQWEGILRRNSNKEWEEIRPLPGLKWSPAKYMTAPGAKRNETLMCYDQSVIAAMPIGIPWIGLTEGPLDAARLGVPFCPLLGKHMSQTQAELCEFPYVVGALQNDEYSRVLRDKIVGRMALVEHKPKLVFLFPPEEYEDFGAMPDALAKEFVQKELKKHGLQYPI